ncbi:MAG: DUF1330 domain-containing protein [Desulfobacterales bacterium]
MASIEPTGEQLRQLRDMDHDGPIVMLNLLKFKPDGGAELYNRYSEVAGRLVTEIGGRIIYYGSQKMPVIGHEEWDAVLLVQYPSVSAFLAMTSDERYQEAVHYRNEALLDSRLYALETIPKLS